ADTENQRIRVVTADGMIHTVAGNGTFGIGGDGAAATSAQLALPFDVEPLGLNALFIADTYNSRVRKLVWSTNRFGFASGGGTVMTTIGETASVRTGYARVQSSSGPEPGGPVGLAIISNRAGGVLISETDVSASAPRTSGRLYADVEGS